MECKSEMGLDEEARIYSDSERETREISGKFE
jgi:hypothetical protein